MLTIPTWVQQNSLLLVIVKNIYSAKRDLNLTEQWFTHLTIIVLRKTSPPLKYLIKCLNRLLIIKGRGDWSLQPRIVTSIEDANPNQLKRRLYSSACRTSINIPQIVMFLQSNTSWVLESSSLCDNLFTAKPLKIVDTSYAIPLITTWNKGSIKYSTPFYTFFYTFLLNIAISLTFFHLVTIKKKWFYKHVFPWIP